MRTDGRTGITKLIVAFQNFANAPKIVKYITYTILEKGTSGYICCIMRKTRTGIQPPNQRVVNTSKNKLHSHIYNECSTIGRKM